MASAEEPGQFQIKFSDQAESNPLPVFANHTNIISGAAKASPTGETLKAIPKAYEGFLASARTRGRVLVFFESDATDIVESEESKWEIPLLLRDDRSGALITRKVLTNDNMTGFTAAGTVDVTATAGVPQRIAYWDVPRGLTAEIDPNAKVRAYLGDDTA